MEWQATLIDLARDWTGGGYGFPTVGWRGAQLPHEESKAKELALGPFPVITTRTVCQGSAGLAQGAISKKFRRISMLCNVGNVHMSSNLRRDLTSITVSGLFVYFLYVL